MRSMSHITAVRMLPPYDECTERTALDTSFDTLAALIADLESIAAKESKEVRVVVHGESVVKTVRGTARMVGTPQHLYFGGHHLLYAAAEVVFDE